MSTEFAGASVKRLGDVAPVVSTDPTLANTEANP